MAALGWEAAVAFRHPGLDPGPAFFFKTGRPRVKPGVTSFGLATSAIGGGFNVWRQHFNLWKKMEC
ncbi:MAG: hypothetical protein ACREB0_00005, partial [Sphingopyxis sp.]